MTEYTTIATITQLIDNHRAIPIPAEDGGGWRCGAEGCPWTYDGSPLPMFETAKHQAHVIQEALPVTAPSVEQIAEALRTAWRDDYSVRSIAEAIHALYGTPGDAGESISEGDYNAMHGRARKAEVRVRDLEDKGRFIAAEREQAYAERDERENIARAEIERHKAALEAAEEALRTEQENHRATVGLYEAGRQRREAGERHTTSAARAMAAADAFTAAARAAVEAETSEEAGASDRDEADEIACAWTTYRDDYGVHASDTTTAHKAFKAGWKAARKGDQSGVLR